MSAIMIPSVFKKDTTDKRSCEEEIYNSLRDNLSEDYFVYNSVKASFRNKNKTNSEAEADFIIFNPKKGLIVVEAKHISGFKIENGIRKDNNDIEIHYGDGPYYQAKHFMSRLKDSIKTRIPEISSKFPITYIVWFHGMSQEAIDEINTLSDIELQHTFSKDDLLNPTYKIEKLLNEQALKDKILQELNKHDKKILEQIMNIHAFVFDVKSNIDDKEKNFNVLLDDQKRILDFLEFQQVACIQGLGGTGKTVIAVEKAKRCAFKGKTLFLCFNSELNKKLAKDNKDLEYVDFQTTEAFKGSRTYSALYSFILSDAFDYKNVIIDEAQDIAHDIIDSNPNAQSMMKELLDKIFEAFKEQTQKRDGCFYVFFDKYQCIQSESKMLPDFINRPECLLTLNINCRNTVEISNTSTAPLVEGYKDKIKINNIVNKAVHGEKPNLFVCSNEDAVIKQLNNSIDVAIGKYGKDVVILTVKTLDTTLLKNSEKYDLEKGLFESDNNGKIKVSTVRKFKGLEANTIILIDVTEKTFDITDPHNLSKPIMLFYVGCSRAKFKLDILTVIDKNKLQEILELCYRVGDARKTFAELANLLSTNPYQQI